jgi:hypothetical protein
MILVMTNRPWLSAERHIRGLNMPLMSSEQWSTLGINKN